MFRFADPDILYALLALPLAALAWWWSDRQARRRLAAFVGPRLGGALTADNSPWRALLGRVAWLLAVAALIAGLARPQVGLARQSEAGRGLDLLFLVDTSRSMAAGDEVPTRLDRVKRSLFYLIDKLEGNRIGLIEFAGVPFELCPLTQDVGALKLLCDALETTDLPVPGTDLGGALQLALQAFGRASQTGARNRALIVFSDGENFGSLPYPAVKRAAAEGIRAYALGVGTTAGASVPALGVQAAPAKTLTKLQEKPLSLLALFGGGTYARLSAGGQEEDALVEELSRLEKLEHYSSRSLTWDDRYPWPAALAALLLWAELLLGRRRGRWHWPTGWRRWLPAFILLGWVLAGAAPLRAASTRDLVTQGLQALRRHEPADAQRALEQAVKRRPQDPWAQYNLGCLHLAQYKYLEALPAFSRAVTRAQGRLLRDAWYNLGYAAFFLGLQQGQAERWTEAATAFERVLLLDPQDEDARYNLELVLREIRRHTQQRARRESQSQGGKQGPQPGGGADKPGEDRMRSDGRNQDQAPPREAQEQTTRREKNGERSSTSEDQKGNRQRGMSQENALRTLRSLESDEQDLQKNRQRFEPDANPYRGPYW
jgi:Ca-activated chloride channel family protein